MFTLYSVFFNVFQIPRITKFLLISPIFSPPSSKEQHRSPISHAPTPPVPRFASRTAPTRMPASRPHHPWRRAPKKSIPASAALPPNGEKSPGFFPCAISARKCRSISGDGVPNPPRMHLVHACVACPSPAHPHAQSAWGCGVPTAREHGSRASAKRSLACARIIWYTMKTMCTALVCGGIPWWMFILYSLFIDSHVSTCFVVSSVFCVYPVIS